MLDGLLSSAGFRCVRADRNGVANLFAKFEGPKGSRVFGFNGHTDVVPAGDTADWSRDPFGGEISDGWIWGRGAADMKSGVAAFVAAGIDFVHRFPEAGTVIITVTGDEEGRAADGTAAILDWMKDNGERLDACLVGEPTCPSVIGEMIKIGRRGSLTAKFTAHGTQGHSAYPQRARNPVEAIARLATRLRDSVLDKGSDNFSPTTLAVTNIDTGNTASNVIPGRCRATVNIRFNDLHSCSSLSGWLRGQADAVQEEFGVSIDMDCQLTGDSFVTPPGPLSELVAGAVEMETGRRPELSTSGGTSDARFIKDLCPVVEFGLVGETIHQTDERVRIEDIRLLKAIYFRILCGFFA